MSIRRLIAEVDVDGLNVTEFCREHGVSTWFFYQLRRRYAAGGEAGLESRSRAATTVANRTPDWIEDLVVEKRKELNEGGWDAGAGDDLEPSGGDPSCRSGPVGGDHLADAHPSGVHHPATEEGSQTCLPHFCCGAGQRVLAARRHRIPACRRLDGEDHHAGR